MSKGETFHIVATRKLGLAAWMKMNGCELLGFTRKEGFTFKAMDPLDVWVVGYANSCCSKHDAELINLRSMMRST